MEIRSDKLQTHYRYDAVANTIGLEVKLDNTTLYKEENQYNLNNSLLASTIQKDGQTYHNRYVYDQEDKLIQSNHNGSQTVYTVDFDGNQTRIQDGVFTQYKHNEKGQLESATTNGKTTYFYYDDTGNLLQEKQGSTHKDYHYDRYNNLVSIQDTTGSLYQYGYNTLNLKISQQISQGKTIYTYKPQESQTAIQKLIKRLSLYQTKDLQEACLLSYYNKDKDIQLKETTTKLFKQDSLVSSYTAIEHTNLNNKTSQNTTYKQQYLYDYRFENPKLLQQQDNTQTKHYVLDDVGYVLQDNLVLIKDSLNNIIHSLKDKHLVHSYSYSDYGMRDQVYNPFDHQDMLLGYRSYMQSFDGSLYLLARHYNPSTSYFITKDSYRGDGSPSTLSKYNYVLNNPYKYIDADGHRAVYMKTYGGVLKKKTHQPVKTLFKTPSISSTIHKYAPAYNKQIQHHTTPPKPPNSYKAYKPALHKNQAVVKQIQSNSKQQQNIASKINLQLTNLVTKTQTLNHKYKPVQGSLSNKIKGVCEVTTSKHPNTCIDTFASSPLNFTTTNNCGYSKEKKQHTRVNDYPSIHVHPAVPYTIIEGIQSNLIEYTIEKNAPNLLRYTAYGLHQAGILEQKLSVPIIDQFGKTTLQHITHKVPLFKDATTKLLRYADKLEDVLKPASYLKISDIVEVVKSSTSFLQGTINLYKSFVHNLKQAFKASVLSMAITFTSDLIKGKTLGEAAAHTGYTGAVAVGTAALLGTLGAPVWLLIGSVIGLGLAADAAYEANFLGIQDGVDGIGHFIDDILQAPILGLKERKQDIETILDFLKKQLNQANDWDAKLFH